MISLKPVCRNDLDTLFELELAPDQRAYVAPNDRTLAEFAYLSGGYAFAIWQADRIVGLMGLVDFREHDELEEGDDPNAAFLMRMMVAREHQGKGFGRKALELAMQWARSRGNSCFQTSVVPGNDVAMRLYASMGMKRTGRIVEDEIELSVDL